LGDDGKVEPPPRAPELVLGEEGRSLARIRALTAEQSFVWGWNRVRVASDPLTVTVTEAAGRTCQDLRIASNGVVDFALGAAPLFGLGQGGQQFDRRGGVFARINGQGEGVRSLDMNAPGARAPEYAFDLAGEGARITIPWLVSAEGWAIYFCSPGGSF